MRSARLIPVWCALLVLIAGAAHWWVPWLTRERDFAASIPQPPPLFTLSLIKLKSQQRACFPDAVMDRHSEVARFRVRTLGHAAQPMTLALSGSGYRIERDVPPTYRDKGTISVPVRPPPADMAVTACISNEGRRAIALYAASDQTMAPYHTSVDGERVPGNPQFGFFERRPVSIYDRIATMMARAAVFRPSFVGPWLYWPLIALVAVGVPAGVVWALFAGWADGLGERDRPRTSRR